MIWHEILSNPAPRDRPVGMLSIQPQENGGAHITFDIVQWNGELFELGYNFSTGIGHDCATHWCEIEDLNLPLERGG